MSSDPEDGLNPYVCPLSILVKKGGKAHINPGLCRILIGIVGRVCGRHGLILGKILPLRLVLSANVPMCSIFCGNSKARTMSKDHHGRGGVPKQFEEAEIIKHLQALSIEVA